MTAARAGRVAGAATLVLAAGLVPVWALALQTPFRLIDDYGALIPLTQTPAPRLLREAFSLAFNPVRFRPTHDIGQVLCWTLLGDAPAAHHAVRLGMKLLAFAAFLGVARREVARAGARTSFGLLAAAPLALALFFYLPNSPEARLAPQELALTLYLLAALFIVGWRPTRIPPAATDALFLLCFALALWSKEPAFIVATPVLALAWVPSGQPPRSVSMPARLFALAAWLHAAAKSMVMSAGGGYARPPLTLAGVRKMAAGLSQQVLLTGSVPWLWMVLAAGAALCAWHQRDWPAQDRRTAWVPWALVAGALVQYLLLWEPVLRYGYPLLVILCLAAVVGFATAVARATPAAAAGWTLGITALALALAAAAYGHLAAQFAMQRMAGAGEQEALQGAERAARDPGAALFVTATSEYEYRARMYFMDFLPRFAGRGVDVKAVRRPGDVPVDGLLLSRGAVPDAFAVVTPFAAPARPRILDWSEAVSSDVRGGRPLGPAPLDAGSPGLPPLPWFLLRRLP